MRLISLVLLLYTYTPQPVRAEPPPPRPQPDVTEYAFDDDAVLGDTVQPLGEVLRVRQGGARSSLVRARSSFVPELLESVQRL